MYIVSVEPHRVIAHDDDDNEYTITNLDTFKEIVKMSGGSCYFSSTMDFPREATSDPAVLALVAEIDVFCGKEDGDE